MKKLLLALLLGSSSAAAAPGPGPGPIPQPWGWSNFDLFFNQGGLMLPRTVAGGSKGVGTINAQGLYVNGAPVFVSGQNLSCTQLPALGGDITTTAGSCLITLVNVNSNVGSFGGASSVPTFTVNAKGLVTAAGSVAVVAPAGTLSGTTLAAGVTGSSLTGVGTLTSGWINWAGAIQTSGQITSTWGVAGLANFLASNSGAAGYGWAQSGAGANAGSWDALAYGGQLHFRATDDIGSSVNNWLTVSRTGYVPTLAAFGERISATDFTGTIGATTPNTGTFTSVNLPAGGGMYNYGGANNGTAITDGSNNRAIVLNGTVNGTSYYLNTVHEFLDRGNTTVFAQITATGFQGAIGATTPAKGAFTTISATGNITGPAFVLAAGGGILNSAGANGYTLVQDGSGTTSLLLGGTTYNTNYYLNTAHYFQTRTGVNEAAITGTGFQGAIGAGTPNTGAFTSIVSNSTVPLISEGAGAGFEANDRSTTGNAVFYRTGGITYLYDSVFGDALSLDTLGNITALGALKAPTVATTDNSTNVATTANATAKIAAALPSATATQLYGGTGAAGAGAPVSIGAGLSLAGNVLSNTTGSSVPRSFLAGLTLSTSTAGGSTSFGVASGTAANSTNAYLLSFTSALTKTTGAWTAGTGGGCLDTGTIAAATWYAVFIIGTSTGGSPDIICHLEVAGTAPVPTLPSAYSGGVYRYIGSMMSDSSNNWVAFLQYGNNFYRPPVADLNSSATFGPTLTTLTVPLGVSVQPMENAFNGTSGGGATNTFLVGPGNAPTTFMTSLGSNANFGVSFTTVLPPTNLSGQVYLQAGISSGYVALTTYGWVDSRGRDN